MRTSYVYLNFAIWSLVLLLTPLAIRPARAQCPADGDVNQQLDGATPADALLVLRHVLGQSDGELAPCQQQRANVVETNDSPLTPADARCILRQFLSLPSCLNRRTTGEIGGYVYVNPQDMTAVILGQSATPPPGLEALVAATVRVTGQEEGAVTDSSGFFQLTNVPAGLRQLRISVEGDLLSTVPVTVLGQATISVGTPPVTRQQATAMVAQDVARAVALETTIILGPQQPLPVGVEVASTLGLAGMTADLSPMTYLVQTAQWFFYVDLFPNARFAHPVRYYFVDASDGRLTMQESDSWPALNGLMYYGSAERNRDSPDLIRAPVAAFGGLRPEAHLETLPEVGATQEGEACSEGRNFGLVILGDQRDDFRFDAQNMVEFMNTCLNAFTLEYSPPPRGRLSAADQIRNTFNRLCSEAGPCDTLFISFHTHGHLGPLGGGRDPHLTLLQGTYQDGGEVRQDVIRYNPATDLPLADCTAGRLVITLDVCHAGAMLTELRQQIIDNIDAFRQTEIIVLASSAEAEVSLGDDVPNNGNSGFFTNALLQGFLDQGYSTPLTTDEVRLAFTQARSNTLVGTLANGGSTRFENGQGIPGQHAQIYRLVPFAHTVGIDPPDPLLATVTLHHPSDAQQPIMWSANGGNFAFALDISPAFGTLQPGESVDVTVRFDSSALFEDFVTTVTFGAATPDGGAHELTALTLSGDVSLTEPVVFLFTDLGSHAQGSVIPLSRFQGVRVVEPNEACDVQVIHELLPGEGMFIDGDGPFMDPSPDGCGFGEIIVPSHNTAPQPQAPAIDIQPDTTGTTQVVPNDGGLGQTHTFAITTPPEHGTATVDVTGQVVYTPDTGFMGTDSLQVTVTDNGGLSGTVTIPITVMPERRVSLGVFPSAEGPEGIHIFDRGLFGLPANGLYAVIGHGSFSIHDLQTGMAVFPNVAEGFVNFGAFPLLPPAGDVQQVLGFGPQGRFTSAYLPDTDQFSAFARLLDPFGGNVTDAQPCPANAAGAHPCYVHVNATTGEVCWNVYDPSLDPEPDYVAACTTLPGASGAPVSADFCTPSGPLLVLTDGAPGELWYHDPTTNASTRVEAVGTAPRRLRCTDDPQTGGRLCVQSNFVSRTLQLYSWSSCTVPPQRLAAVEVGDGPVGVDVQVLDNGQICTVSTGFNDHTVTVSTIARDGSLVQQEMTSTLPDCLNPGHAIFVDAQHLLYTCNGNAAYVVREYTCQP